MIIGDRLKEAIRIRGYKQIDVANATKIPKSLLCDYINGRRNPKQEYLTRLSKFLNVSEKWLKGYHVPMEPTASNDSYSQKFREAIKTVLGRADDADKSAANINVEHIEAVIDESRDITIDEAAYIADELGESLPEISFLDRVVERANEFRLLHDLEPYTHKWTDNFQSFIKNYIESGGEIGSIDKDSLLAVAEGYTLSFDAYCQTAEKLGLSLDKMVGLNISSDERIKEFQELFNQLTPEQQNLITAQIKGILSSEQ